MSEVEFEDVDGCCREANCWFTATSCFAAGQATHGNRVFYCFSWEEFVPRARRSDKLERSVWCVSAVPMQMCLASMVWQKQNPMMIPNQIPSGNQRWPWKIPYECLNIGNQRMEIVKQLQVPLALERCSSADGGNPEADLANHIVKTSENQWTK